MDDGLKIILDEIRKDIRRLEEKVDKLNAFKWKMIGMVAVAGSLGGGSIATMAFKLLK